MATVEETEVEEAKPANMGIVKFNKTEAELMKLEEYKTLVINGIDDKAGFKACYEARQIVKKTRISVEKHKKLLKEDALRWNRDVDVAFNKIMARISPVEEHLESQENLVEMERERIKKEAADKAAAKLNERLDQLTACGVMMHPGVVGSMTDAFYATELARYQTEHAAKVKAAEDAAAAAKVEADRLAALQAELDKQREAQAAAQKALDDKAAAIAKQEADAKAEQDRIVAAAHAVAAKVRPDHVPSAPPVEPVATVPAWFDDAPAKVEPTLFNAHPTGSADHTRLADLALAVETIDVPNFTNKSAEVKVRAVLDGAAVRIRSIAKELA